MRFELRAIGRLKAGPERTLVDDYLKRASQTSRALGLGPFEECEIDPRPLKSKSAETEALTDGLDGSDLIIALDETGKGISSIELSQFMMEARDEGARLGVMLIGGADGHERKVLPHTARKVSFGRATWPHMLCRVMAAEQLYRASTILAGLPYHREG
jgi:23S rRNA (pseudouridine1915-N3)-methyltransferase